MTENRAAYWAEPLTWEFEARVSQKTDLGNNRFEVVLEKSYFYPSGGGQLHDTGTLGEARVVEVVRADDGRIVHRVEGDISGPVVMARIDGARRLGHMQHHSAQHIVSRALEQLFGLETQSARISAASPSTVDVPDVEMSGSEVAQVERLVNQLVFENRPIKTYFISEDQLETVPLRRPPKVSGQIRIVEVEAFDYSACGGTHCLSTGMIGLIKIIRTERKNKKLRFHFVAGRQALATFQDEHEIVAALCQQLNTRPEEVLRLINRQTEQLAAAQQELNRLQADLLSVEAAQLTAQANPIGSVRLVTRQYLNRPMSELRELAKLLQTQADLVAALAGYDGQKLSLVVSCAAETGINGRELLAQALTPIGGKGSGDARLAQGGGSATAEQVAQVLTEVRALLKG